MAASQSLSLACQRVTYGRLVSLEIRLLLRLLFEKKVLVDRTHAGLLPHIAPPTLLGHAAAGIPARRDLARQLGDGVTATHAVGREAPRPRRCTACCHNSALPITLCAVSGPDQ